MMHDHEPRTWAEEQQLDEEAERELFVAHAKAVFRAVERVTVYAALALGFVLVGIMLVRCTPAVFHYITASPAPRSPAPQAIATPQPRAFEAGARSTGQVR